MAIGTAAAIIGGSILGAGANIIGSGRAARAIESGSQQAADVSQQQFQELLRLTAPQRQFGDQAINELSRLFGFDVGQDQPQNELTAGAPFAFRGRRGRLESPGVNEVFPAGTGPNLRGEEALPTGLDVFQASPDFQFRQEQGLEGIAQTLGAGGAGAFSGNALRSLNEFNSNLASGEFGDFINRRLAAAGLGQVSTSQAGQGALTTGLSVGNQLQNQGNARASGILGQTAATGNLVKDLVEAILAQGGGSGGGAFTPRTIGPP